MKKCSVLIIIILCMLFLGDVYSVSGKTITDNDEYSDIQVLTLEQAIMRSNKIDMLRKEKTRFIRSNGPVSRFSTK